MGAKQDLARAQSGIARQQSIIKAQEAALARKRKLGQPTASVERTIAAAKANIGVLRGRATKAFQEVAREAAQRAAARARAAAAAKAKAEAAAKARAKAAAAAKAKAEAEAKTRRDAEARKRAAETALAAKKKEEAARLAARKAEEERARKEQAALLEVTEPTPPEAREPKPLEEEIAQLVEMKEERLEKARAEERLIEGVGPFETQEFAREGIPISPEEAEGRVITGLVKEQDIFSLVGGVEQVKKFQKVTLAPTGQEALKIAKEQRVTEPDFTTGRTVLVPAEEAGVPGLRGEVVGELEPFSVLGEEERFEAAAAEFEIRGEPELPKRIIEARKAEAARAVKPARFNDPISQIQAAGLTPTQKKIQTGFVPFGQEPTAFAGTLESLFAEPKAPPPRKRGIAPGVPAFVAAPETVKPAVEGFGSFLGGIGKTLGIDISSDFFKTISAGVTFESTFGGLVPGVERKPPKKPTKKAQAKAQIALLKKQRRSIPGSLIAQAFPEKAARAKKAGFTISSEGRIFSKKAGILGTTVAGVKSTIKKRKQEEARRKREIAQRKAREAAERRARKIRAAKRARQRRAAKKKARIVGARRPTVRKPSVVRPTVRVTRPSKAARGVRISQLAIRSKDIPTVGELRFAKPPKKPKKPTGVSAPRVFGDVPGRRF